MSYKCFDSIKPGDTFRWASNIEEEHTVKDVQEYMIPLRGGLRGRMIFIECEPKGDNPTGRVFHQHPCDEFFAVN